MPDAEQMIYAIAELVYLNGAVPGKNSWRELCSRANAGGTTTFAWYWRNRCMTTAQNIYSIMQEDNPNV